MLARLLPAAAAAAVFLGAAPRVIPLTVYHAPAGTRPAGASAKHATDAVLPDGRIAAPIGQTVFVGTNPQGVALSPDGRFAIVSNDDENTDLAPPLHASGMVAGYSLTVVDTRTMHVSDVYHDADTAFFAGIAAVRDPHNPAQTLVLASDGMHDVVHVFDLTFDGQLLPESNSIALPVASAPGYAIDRRAFPASIAVSRDGRTAYVVENLGQIVAAIDIGARTVLHGTQVGLAPFGIAIAGERLFTADAGLETYRDLLPPQRAARFAAPDVDPTRASSLAIVSLTSDGDVDTNPGDVTYLRMDPAPDGTVDVGGIVPSAIAVRSDGSYAYVALANVDRVAVVSMRDSPQVVDGLDLRLFPDAPYGTQPSAEVLSADDSRLYIALAGLNAIAILDARAGDKLHRLGLIPTGWYPSALALSSDGRWLYVTAAKGVGGWGLLQKIDLHHLSPARATLAALRYNRTAAYAQNNALVPPLRTDKRSNAIHHVFYISIGVDGYDAMLGDLTDTAGQPHGNGSSSFSLYPESITPNLHALARDFALADNFYAEGSAAASVQFATAATATLPVERMAPVGSARAPMEGYGEDPEDYPRSGFLFNALARAGLTFRDYGALLQVSGYTDGLYTLGVPALATLGGNVDLDYAAWNPRITDAQRAQEFIRDFGVLSEGDRVPDFTFVWLPTPPSGEDDADRALGQIVEAITHSPQWSSTAIFVVPEGVRIRRDHVDGSRIYAVVVSPYARRGFIDRDHLSYASVVKTEEELLGLPPLALGDLLATDLGACFTPTSDETPFQALP